MGPDNTASTRKHAGNISGNSPQAATCGGELPAWHAPDTLTDKAIQRSLKRAAEPASPRSSADGGGLRLDARPTGAGWWRLRYWIGGKEGMLSLGTYPDVTLKRWRAQRRDEARKLIAAGTDPSEARKAEKAEAGAGAEVPATGRCRPARTRHLRACGARVAGDGARGQGQRRPRRAHAHPLRAGRLPLDRPAPDCRDRGARAAGLLRRVTARGAIETAHRLKDACAQVFRYGIATGALHAQPGRRSARRAAARCRRATMPPSIDPKRAAELLRAMGDYAGHPVTRAALALSALLFLRPGELRQMEWAWVDLDGGDGDDPGRADEAQEGRQGERRAAPGAAGAAGGGDPARAAPADRARRATCSRRC